MVQCSILLPQFLPLEVDSVLVATLEREVRVVMLKMEHHLVLVLLEVLLQVAELIPEEEVVLADT